MIKEDRLDQGLQQVYHEIVPPHMGQLMRQDGFQLPGGKARRQAGWQQDYRPQAAKHDRHLRQRRLQHTYGTAQAESFRHALQFGQHLVRSRRHTHAAQSPQRVPPQQRTEGAHHDTQAPSCHDPRQPWPQERRYLLRPGRCGLNDGWSKRRNRVR